jgi:hypothetical protein
MASLPQFTCSFLQIFLRWELKVLKTIFNLPAKQAGNTHKILNTAVTFIFTALASIELS